MEIYIICLLQILIFSSCFRRLRRKIFFVAQPWWSTHGGRQYLLIRIPPPPPPPQNFFHFYGPVSATKFIKSVTFLRFYFFNFLNIYFFFVSKFFLFPFNQCLGHSLIFGRRNGILIKLSLNFFDYWMKLKDKNMEKRL